MSKTLEATCAAGIVKVGVLPLAGAKILSAGIGASEGIAIIDEEKIYYAADTTPDLSTTLEKISDGLDTVSQAMTKLVLIITSIGAGMTGPTTAPPPTLATDLLDITQAATDLGLLKAAVDLLKGNLK